MILVTKKDKFSETWMAEKVGYFPYKEFFAESGRPSRICQMKIIAEKFNRLEKSKILQKSFFIFLKFFIFIF